MGEQHKEVSSPFQVFYSYAREDEKLCIQLEKHLSLLQKQSVISTWYDRQIAPGAVWEQVIDVHLNEASIILLLVSPDFLASDYCYSVEMQRALERQRLGKALVIPILLRPVDWENAPFAHLKVLPGNAKPITQWTNKDAAFQDVAQGIRKAISTWTTSEQYFSSPKRNPVHQKKKSPRPSLSKRAYPLILSPLLIGALIFFLLLHSWVECSTIFCTLQQTGTATSLRDVSNLTTKAHDSNLEMYFNTLQSAAYVIPGNPTHYGRNNLPQGIAALHTDGQASTSLYNLVLGLHNLQQGGFGIVINEVDVVVLQVSPLPQHPLNIWSNTSSVDSASSNQYRVLYSGQDATAFLPAEFLRFKNGFVYLNPDETDLIDIHVISRVEASIKFSVQISYRISNNSQPHILKLPLQFEIMFASPPDWHVHNL